MITVKATYEGKDKNENIKKWDRPPFQYDDNQDQDWQELNHQIDMHYAAWLEKYNLAPMTATFTTETPKKSFHYKQNVSNSVNAVTYMGSETPEEFMTSMKAEQNSFGKPFAIVYNSKKYSYREIEESGFNPDILQG